MFHPRAPQALALVPVVVTLLVAETHSHPTQHAAQQIINNDLGAAELGLSIVINQMALLRILNESSILSTTPTSRKTYKVYGHLATQSQATRACQQLGGRLALPKNKEEDEKITRLIGLTFNNDTWREYWISGTDHGEEGTWIDGVTGYPMNYTNFKPGQPDNTYDHEHCLHKSPNYFGWNDIKCTHVAEGYVCEFMDV